MPAVQLTKYHRFNDPYDETSRPTTVDTVFKPASNVTSSQTSSGLENSTRLSSSSNDDHCVMRSPSQLSSTTALPRQADVYRQPTDPEKPVTNDRTPVVASATTMTSAIPPPAPPLPPPAVISASAASVLGSSHVTMTVPRPKLQTKRFQWTKIPVSRAAGGSPTVWTVVGRMLGDSLGPADGGRCSPDFNCLEQLFSVQAASTSGLIGGGASTALFGPGLPPGSGGLLASADGLTLDRRKKPEEVRSLGLQPLASMTFDRWFRAGYGQPRACGVCF
jgi:hypothetical protein